MKYTITLLATLLTSVTFCQNAPSPANPCQKLDTNNIKKMLIGTWVDAKDASHIMVITPDSVEETIVVTMGADTKKNESYWNYTITDNIFSSDDVTCYSLREYKAGYDKHVDNAINSIDAHYLLLGASGKTVFKKQ